MNYTATELRQQTTAAAYRAAQHNSDEIIILGYSHTIIEAWIGDEFVELIESPLGVLIGSCTCGWELPFLCEHCVCLGLHGLQLGPPDLPIILEELHVEHLERLLNDILDEDTDLDILHLLPLHTPEDPCIN